jgi:hypothetical protein
MPALTVRRKTDQDREASRRRQRARQHNQQLSRELDQQLRQAQIREAVARRARNQAHGPECSCPFCVAKMEHFEAKAHEIEPVEIPGWGTGWLFDGNEPMPKVLLDELEAMMPWKKVKRTNADRTLPGRGRDCNPHVDGAMTPHGHEDCNNAGMGPKLEARCLPRCTCREKFHVWQRQGIITDWNLPHHGKGQPWCGDPLNGLTGTKDGQQSLHVWRQLKTCGQRDCQRCGPVFDGDGNILQAGRWPVRTARRVAEKIEAHLLDIEKAMADDAARRITRNEARLWAAAHRPRLSHIVMSPPRSAWDGLRPNEQNQARWDELMEQQCALARRVGIRAGVRVVHGLRLPGRYNDRKHAAEGLHIHVIGLTDDPRGKGWLDHKRVVQAHAETGWVIKRITERCTNFHKGPCAIECRCDQGSEGPDPNRVVLDLDAETARKVVRGEVDLDDVRGQQQMRGAFGTLLYLLSHASWPNLAVLRMPGEEWTRHGVPLRFNRGYPALVKTSSQQKALQPFGDWTRAPETPVVMPLMEEIDPITGQAVPPNRVYVVLVDGGPPPQVPFFMLPPGCYREDPSERSADGRPVVHVDAARLAHLRAELSVPAGKSWPPRSHQAVAVEEQGMSDEAQARWKAYWDERRRGESR